MENDFFKEEDKRVNASINLNYLTLRKYLGISGILLPFTLMIGNGFKIEPSISHYYYTNMSVFFTGTLIAFGLFLISYNGYAKEKNELLSDNIITNCAGFFALIVAFVPTACSHCEAGVPNGHNDELKSTIHLISAGLFIAIMGYMAFVQFVKSKRTDKTTLRRIKFFKLCGIIIWGVVLYLLAGQVFDFKLTTIDVFIGETIALFFFGSAWLVKSKSFENIGL